MANTGSGRGGCVETGAEVNGTRVKTEAYDADTQADASRDAQTTGEQVTKEAGRSLKTLRIQRGLAVREVAEQTGLSVNNLYRIEGGQQKPQLTTLEKLARVYGVSVPALLGQEDIAEAYLRERKRVSRALAAFDRYLNRVLRRWTAPDAQEEVSAQEIRDTLATIDDFVSAGYLGLLVREEPTEAVKELVWTDGLDASDRQAIRDAEETIARLRELVSAQAPRAHGGES